MQRPGLDGLLSALQSGGTPLGGLPRWNGWVANTLGSIGADQPAWPTMGVDLKVLDMPVDAQDVGPATASRSLWSPPEWRAIERANISRRDEAGGLSGPGRKAS